MPAPQDALLPLTALAKQPWDVGLLLAIHSEGAIEQKAPYKDVPQRLFI